MKKSLLLIMLTGTFLVRPQIQECNFTGPSINEAVCQAVFQVTAESIKAVRCRNSGTIRVTLTFRGAETAAMDIPLTVTVNGPNNFSSSETIIIPEGKAFNAGDSIPFEIPVPTGGLYTAITNFNLGGCIFTCRNILVKQINCVPLIYCCTQ